MQLPEDFIRETRLLMGEERFNRFLEAFNEDAPVSIRVNPLKIRNEELGISNCDYPASPESAYRSNHNSSFLIPNSSLKILTPDLPEGEHPHVPLSYSDALKYLRGESLVLPTDTPRGIVTVSYKGIPLGPMKHIGNRANNLYPKPWRIKTTHLPAEPVEILSL